LANLRKFKPVDEIRQIAGFPPGRAYLPLLKIPVLRIDYGKAISRFASAKIV
jgi:hypothetical protein